MEVDLGAFENAYSLLLRDEIYKGRSAKGEACEGREGLPDKERSTSDNPPTLQGYDGYYICREKAIQNNQEYVLP